MAFDAFINFGDIKGEVTEKDHKDWVAATKVSFTVTPPAPARRGTPTAAPKRSDLTVEKPVDVASPKLHEALTKGTHIPQVTIDYTRASGSSAVKYLEVKLKDVVISGISHVAEPKGTSQAPTEQLTLSYGSMEQVFTQQKADGKAGGNVAAKVGGATA